MGWIVLIIFIGEEPTIDEAGKPSSCHQSVKATLPLALRQEPCVAQWRGQELIAGSPKNGFQQFWSNGFILETENGS